MRRAFDGCEPPGGAPSQLTVVSDEEITVYSNTSWQVRCSLKGGLNEEIPTNRGVKQGCPLAPTLFNLLLHDVASNLEDVQGHPPKLVTKGSLCFFMRMTQLYSCGHR